MNQKDETSNRNETPGKPLLTIDEVAEALSVGRNTVYRLIYRGGLPSVTIPGSRCRRIRRNDLTKFIDQLDCV